MQKAGAKALIFDALSLAASNPSRVAVPTYFAVAPSTIASTMDRLPSLVDGLEGSDIFCIFLTSGSTSGQPRLIKCSYSWLDNNIAKADVLCQRRRPMRQDVTTSVGSMTHIAQTFMLPAFASEEMVDMVRRCSLNCLRQFGTFLSIHIRNAKCDPVVLSVLQSLDEAFFCGIGMLPDDEEFATRNSINVKNIFGIDEEKQELKRTKVVAHNAHSIRLLELVILRQSADCPNISLCGPDGNYRTGDLFQEVKPGRYIFRGRDDDWIKSENSLRCDTKSVEDNVRMMCEDLIEDCVVVGTGRPSPALFVEPSVSWEEEKLKREILRCTKQFHSRRYMHERIVVSRFIMVVPKKTLPRTSKGNIRRKAVEESFQTTLNEIYDSKARPL
ncbi:hypothetical protein FRB93_008670 [Tulasnella sp. JGI-2019a]|nr:hypothetical protein FRB93_008670 [Tulasnella sp. JGI-2019a]